MSLNVYSSTMKSPSSKGPSALLGQSMIEPPTPSMPTRPESNQWQHLYVLPVLLMEFLALALTRAVLPSLLLNQYDTSVYLVMGVVECVKGLLAFVSCPLFGKLSDVIGRRICLFVTVAGTCAPVCSLALLSWNPDLRPDSATIASEAAIDITGESEQTTALGPAYWGSTSQPQAITIFVVLLSLSGIFSSTFTLVFAYISDTVKERDERVSAYGLALATFGLSFTLGPMAGGYLARYNTRAVFVSSLVLTILDLLYIYFILPESKLLQPSSSSKVSTTLSLMSDQAHSVSWNPWDTMRIIAVDPFLRRVGQVAFLYYTAVWAVISTLVLYAAQRFGLGPERLGELMSALGLSTMVAEAVLVRIIVPLLGEKRSMRLGLAAFCFQCIVLGLAYEGWHLFVCIAFSLLGHLVYPSLSSLVSGSVEPDAVGEALGAVNGIKALTEGIGPLVFGSLMTLSEKSPLPGWPYLVAAVIVLIAYKYAEHLPDLQEDEYIHELATKKQRQEATRLADAFATDQVRPRGLDYLENDDVLEEYVGLLGSGDEVLISEVDTDNDEDERVGDQSRLPLTFAGLGKKGTYR